MIEFTCSTNALPPVTAICDTKWRLNTHEPMRNVPVQRHPLRALPMLHKGPCLLVYDKRTKSWICLACKNENRRVGVF